MNIFSKFLTCKSMRWNVCLCPKLVCGVSERLKFIGSSASLYVYMSAECWYTHTQQISIGLYIFCHNSLLLGILLKVWVQVFCLFVLWLEAFGWAYWHGLQRCYRACHIATVKYLVFGHVFMEVMHCLMLLSLLEASQNTM